MTQLAVTKPADAATKARAELVAMGPAAVPALIVALDDREHGWRAAMTLTELGAPAAVAAIPALLAHAHDPASGCHLWACCALGALGQLDALMTLVAAEPTRVTAIGGLRFGRPASYAQLAQLLDRGDPKLTKIVEIQLATIVAFEPPPSSLDILVALGHSSHVALRKEAVWVLGSFVAAVDQQRAIGPLMSLLADTVPEIRRLALVWLGDYRERAREAVPRIRTCAADVAEAPAVRATATWALGRIESKKPT
ncbi:MAG: hypothetical protein NT062_00245 [Proteobacteria bacterium]|nr:hypothetical protein [Pseudomonadota bacterium]